MHHVCCHLAQDSSLSSLAFLSVTDQVSGVGACHSRPYRGSVASRSNSNRKGEVWHRIMPACHDSAWMVFLKQVDDQPEGDVLNTAETFLNQLFLNPGKAYAVRLEALAKHAEFPDCRSTQAILAPNPGSARSIRLHWKLILSNPRSMSLMNSSGFGWSTRSLARSCWPLGKMDQRTHLRLHNLCREL